MGFAVLLPPCDSRITTQPWHAQYCGIDECYGNVRIACNSDGSPGSDCGSDFQEIDLTSYQDEIVRMHNDQKNKVASGLFENYPAATNSFAFVKTLSNLISPIILQCGMLISDVG